MNYSAKTPKFSRDQLILIVEIMISAAVDAIDSAHPFFSDMPKEVFRNQVDGIVAKLSWDLSILYHQLTGEGVGCCDVLMMTEADDYLYECCKSQKKRQAEKPITKMATKFVDDLFGQHEGYFNE